MPHDNQQRNYKLKQRSILRLLTQHKLMSLNGKYILFWTVLVSPKDIRETGGSKRGINIWKGINMWASSSNAQGIFMKTDYNPKHCWFHCLPLNDSGLCIKITKHIQGTGEGGHYKVLRVRTPLRPQVGVWQIRSKEFKVLKSQLYKD